MAERHIKPEMETEVPAYQGVKYPWGPQGGRGGKGKLSCSSASPGGWGEAGVTLQSSLTDKGPSLHPSQQPACPRNEPWPWSNWPLSVKAVPARGLRRRGFLPGVPHSQGKKPFTLEGRPGCLPR